MFNQAFPVTLGQGITIIVQSKAFKIHRKRKCMCSKYKLNTADFRARLLPRVVYRANTPLNWNGYNGEHKRKSHFFLSATHWLVPTPRYLAGVTDHTAMSPTTWLLDLMNSPPFNAVTISLCLRCNLNLLASLLALVSRAARRFIHGP